MHEGTNEPLSPQDRDEIGEDLANLDAFQSLLSVRGVRGLVVDCTECDAPHYFAWDLLRENLRNLLDVGSIRVHEPAFDPDPADYVSWDYALGYVDGMLAAAEEEASYASLDGDPDPEPPTRPATPEPPPTIDLR